MKRGAGKWIFPAGAVLGIWAVAQCGEEQTQQTELLLTVASDTQVTEVEILARNIENVADTINEPMGSRNIVAEPLLLLITPSSIIQDRFLVRARGFLDGAVLVAAADVYEFVPNQRVEATLTMTKRFAERDTDSDGFEDCNHVGCDCDDTDPMINPFTEEICSDRVDNNCSGLPINEGCPCRLDDPPVWCTVLTEEFQGLAGIGACTLGTLECLDDGNGDEFGVLETDCDAGTFKVEEESNNIDDDCDGTVDEGSPCDELSTPNRACFLGHIDIQGQPLAELPDAKPVGECSAGIQSCNGGQWGPCKDEVRPQRDTQSHVGWIELPADSDGTASQCDGLDNDCDGRWDEEPYFDGDDDGFTVCGTDLAYGGQYNELIDCNDGDNSINPGATEICGNGIDEDCRCDHDSLDRPEDGCTASEIGCPALVFDTSGTAPFYEQADKVRFCNDAHGHLDCQLDIRSDANPTGTCQDGPTRYYHGYFGSTDTNKNCYYCMERFGVACSANTDACETKDEACCSCEAADPPQSALAEARPLCGSPNPDGCTCDASGPVPPIWDEIIGSDPNGECDGVSCAGYYHGLDGGRCYAKRDQGATDVDCKAGNLCEVPADLCPGETARNPNPVATGVCTIATGGCTGVTPPEVDNQGPGEDLFGECSGTFTCSTNDAQNGGGPFYFGIANDGNDNPQCYLHTDVDASSHDCDGSGACQTRAEACLASARGDIAPGRPPCQSPTGGCSGTTAPTYFFVARYQDPYNDCPGGETCDGVGHCHQQQGETCAGGELCDQNLFCVDDYCCNSECLGSCQSCDGSETVGSNGVCSNITTGTDPASECTGGLACNSGSCATSCSPSCGNDPNNCEAGYFCNGSNNCSPLRSNGTPPDGTCGSDSCSSGSAADGYCCNSDCLGSCQSCDGSETVSSNGVCANIIAGTDPASECSGALACNGGSCAASCSPSCSIDPNNCEAGNYCNSSNNCASLQSNGTAPDGSCGWVSCSSGSAADGYCCNSDCLGECQSCDGAQTVGPNGQCSNIIAGTDPDPECPGGFACNGGACATSCSSSCGNDPSNCEAGNYCNGSNNCASLLSNGTPADGTCGSSSCSSGSAADGYCCNNDCLGQCQSCDGAQTVGSNGQCSNITAGMDPDSECAGGFACNDGSCATSCSPSCSIDPNNCEAGSYCNSTNSCASLRSNGVAPDGSCGSVSCSSGSAADGYCCNSDCLGECQSCDGTETVGSNGQCSNIIAGTDPASECTGGLACNGGSCPSSCTGGCTSNDCETATYFCSSNSCASLLSNGVTPDGTCGADSCSSGYAADGLCCDTACNTACYSCDGADNTGGDGVCSFFATVGSTDTAPTVLCSGTSGCGLSDCACNDSGGCRGTGGAYTCTEGGQCLSGFCDQLPDPDACTSF